MADATKLSLADLQDPAKYVCKKGVPWFCPHKRQVWNEKTAQFEDLEVNESDISEIFQNMKALAKNNRAFRITNGHIKKDADEKDQPEFLGLALPEAVATFGEDKIPCINMTEYVRVDKVDTISDRPYRSAEYYRGKKLITGCAALLRDPQLNLGVVLYSGDEVAVLYGEPVDTVIPKASTNEDDLSPEEVDLFEKMIRYMQKKQQQEAAQQMSAIGPANAMQPQQQPAAYQEQEMSNPVVKPDEQAVHYAELVAENTSLKKRLDGIEADRKKEKAETLLDRLDKIEHYKFDRADELEAMLNTDDAGREKIANRIRKNHEKQPGYDDAVPVDYSADNLPLPKREGDTNPLTVEPEFYQETLDYIRETGEKDFAKAQRAVKLANKK